MNIVVNCWDKHRLIPKFKSDYWPLSLWESQICWFLWAENVEILPPTSYIKAFNWKKTDAVPTRHGCHSWFLGLQEVSWAWICLIRKIWRGCLTRRVPLLQGEYVVCDVLQHGRSTVIWEYGSARTMVIAHALFPEVNVLARWCEASHVGYVSTYKHHAQINDCLWKLMEFSSSSSFDDGWQVICVSIVELNKKLNHLISKFLYAYWSLFICSQSLLSKIFHILYPSFLCLSWFILHTFSIMLWVVRSTSICSDFLFSTSQNK